MSAAPVDGRICDFISQPTFCGFHGTCALISSGSAKNDSEVVKMDFISSCVMPWSTMEKKPTFLAASQISAVISSILWSKSRSEIWDY